MPRWPGPPLVECERLRAKAVTLNGTLMRGDTVLVGKADFVSQACVSLTVRKSAWYAAVNTMCAQPWVMRIDGQPVTFASSAQHWLENQRRDEAKAHRAEIDWRTYGKSGGRPPQ